MSRKFEEALKPTGTEDYVDPSPEVDQMIWAAQAASSPDYGGPIADYLRDDDRRAAGERGESPRESLMIELNIGALAAKALVGRGYAAFNSIPFIRRVRTKIGEAGRETSRVFGNESVRSGDERESIIPHYAHDPATGEPLNNHL